MHIEQFGELRAHVKEGERNAPDDPVVVLLHGFGALGDDLVDLGDALPVPPNVRFVFPEAPLLVDRGPGRAWWMIDPELFERRARGERVDRTRELPPGLPEARRLLSSALDAMQARFSIDRSRMILGGFSQGSMLACDLALHEAQQPGGLVLLSSTLIARSLWEPRMASLRGLRVLQTHGYHDPILPYGDAEKLAELLQEAGARHTFVDFAGGHEIAPPAARALARFIADAPATASR
jgi:phospholipase/carboxylesterase